MSGHHLPAGIQYPSWSPTGNRAHSRTSTQLQNQAARGIIPGPAHSAGSQTISNVPPRIPSNVYPQVPAPAHILRKLREQSQPSQTIPRVPHSGFFPMGSQTPVSNASNAAPSFVPSSLANNTGSKPDHREQKDGSIASVASSSQPAASFQQRRSAPAADFQSSASGNSFPPSPSREASAVAAASATSPMSHRPTKKQRLVQNTSAGSSNTQAQPVPQQAPPYLRSTASSSSSRPAWMMAAPNPGSRTVGQVGSGVVAQEASAVGLPPPPPILPLLHSQQQSQGMFAAAQPRRWSALTPAPPQASIDACGPHQVSFAPEVTPSQAAHRIVAATKPHVPQRYLHPSAQQRQVAQRVLSQQHQQQPLAQQQSHSSSQSVATTSGVPLQHAPQPGQQQRNTAPQDQSGIPPPRHAASRPSIAPQVYHRSLQQASQPGQQQSVASGLSVVPTSAAVLASAQLSSSVVAPPAASLANQAYSKQQRQQQNQQQALQQHAQSASSSAPSSNQQPPPPQTPPRLARSRAAQNQGPNTVRRKRPRLDEATIERMREEMRADMRDDGTVPEPFWRQFKVGDAVDVWRTSGVWDTSGWRVFNVSSGGYITVDHLRYSGSNYGPNKSRHCFCGDFSPCSNFHLRKHLPLDMVQATLRPSQLKLQGDGLSAASLIERKVCTDVGALILEYIDAFEVMRTVNKVSKRFLLWSRVSLLRPRKVLVPSLGVFKRVYNDPRLLDVQSWQKIWATIPRATQYRLRPSKSSHTESPSPLMHFFASHVLEHAHSEHLNTLYCGVPSQERLFCLGVRFPNLVILSVHVPAWSDTVTVDFRFLRQLPRLEVFQLNYTALYDRFTSKLTSSNLDSFKHCPHMSRVELGAALSTPSEFTTLIKSLPAQHMEALVACFPKLPPTDRAAREGIKSMVLDVVALCGATLPRLKKLHLLPLSPTDVLRQRSCNLVMAKVSDQILSRIGGLEHVFLTMKRGELVNTLPNRRLFAKSLALTMTVQKEPYVCNTETTLTAHNCVHYESYAANTMVTYGRACNGIQGILQHFPLLTKLSLLGHPKTSSTRRPSLSRHLDPAFIPHLRKLRLHRMLVEPEFMPFQELKVITLVSCTLACSYDELGRNLACLPELKELWIVSPHMHEECIELPALVKHLRLKMLSIPDSKLSEEGAAKLFDVGVNPVKISL